MIIKNIIRYSIICGFIVQGVNSGEWPNQRREQYEASVQREETKPSNSYMPSKETVAGLSLTFGGIYSIFTNKNIPYKYKLGILGITLGTGIIYCSENTSSFVKHAYTAVGSAALTSVPFSVLGLIGGTILGGGAVILYFYHVNERSITVSDALKASVEFFTDIGVQEFLGTAMNQNENVRVKEKFKQLSE